MLHQSCSCETPLYAILASDYIKGVQECWLLCWRLRKGSKKCCRPRLHLGCVSSSKVLTCFYTTSASWPLEERAPVDIRWSLCHLVAQIYSPVTASHTFGDGQQTDNPWTFAPHLCILLHFFKNNWPNSFLADQHLRLSVPQKTFDLLHSAEVTSQTLTSCKKPTSTTTTTTTTTSTTTTTTAKATLARKKLSCWSWTVPIIDGIIAGTWQSINQSHHALVKSNPEFR